MPTNVNQELKAKLVKARVSKKTLKLIRGQAKRVFGKSGGR